MATKAFEEASPAVPLPIGLRLPEKAGLHLRLPGSGSRLAVRLVEICDTRSTSVAQHAGLVRNPASESPNMVTSMALQAGLARSVRTSSAEPN
jgi:hypothetical protein